MKNIEITLGNKVRHILNKLNIKVPVEIIKNDAYTIEVGDDFDNTKVEVTMPERYDINIPIEFSEKLWKVFNRFENKYDNKKYDFAVNVCFTGNL